MAKITPKEKRGPGRPKGSKNKKRTTPVVKAKPLAKATTTGKLDKDEEAGKLFLKSLKSDVVRTDIEQKTNAILQEFAKNIKEVSEIALEASISHLDTIREHTCGIIDEDIEYLLNLNHRIITHSCCDVNVSIETENN